MTKKTHPSAPVPPPWWPDLFSRKRPFLETRQRVLRAARAFFESENFAEVDTPALQVSPGNEVHLQAFRTELRDPRGGDAQTLYLHTSPELAMKKLLVAGEPRLFQLAHVFRNAERSRRHHPEFTMLEWYRAESAAARPEIDSLEIIRQDCVRLVRAAAKASGKKTFSAGGMTCDPFAEWEKLGVAEAFQRYAKIDLLATAPEPNNPDVGLLRQAAAPLGLRMAKDDRWDDLVFRIMMEKIEPHLGKDRPTFLCDYPVSMAALARPKAEDPRLAERFELYIAGIEIANAFGELTDPAEQARRFQADMDLKEKLYGERFPIDADFLEALRCGMPPSAGVALGFDRLVMLCAGTEDI
ncbi:MAG: EF-P lysine aminoacylase GenX, partial [Alphaproteobacteria bacterium]|nr:EF-P lysine aminoacylase GenX [Alphaproteobacteria bacterium]